jgi:4-hydroxy-tetrahydrodipicolinate synthase
MHLDATASGVFPIAPTPFYADGLLDEASIDTLIQRYLAAGVNGVTVLGIMGEAPKLELDEAVQVARLFIRGFGELPVIVGVSVPGFAAMRSLSNAVMEIGAAGVMIAPLPSLRTDEQIIDYYRQAADAIGPGTPFVIQDYPLTLSVQMTPGVIREIAQEHANCVMLKHEDWPGLEKISTLRKFQREGTLKPISILTGNGGLFLDFEMERGADGAMTGYAFPEMLADVVKLQKDGKRNAAHDLFDAHLPLLRYEHQQGVGLAVRKYVLMKRGFIVSDTQRKPGAALSEFAKKEVDFLLDRLATHDVRARVG